MYYKVGDIFYDIGGYKHIVRDVTFDYDEGTVEYITIWYDEFGLKHSDFFRDEINPRDLDLEIELRGDK